MSFSFLGSLASLLPGYIQGQRMANQDNWSDLMNYNKAQQGQFSNMFTEATFQPQMDMVWMDRFNKALGTAQNTWQTGLNYMAQPQLMNQVLAGNYYSPALAGLPYEMQLRAYGMQQGLGNLMRQPSWAQGNPQTPSGAI